MTKIQKFLLIAIILLAIFFRYYQIASMPGGLFPDEAANGLDINLMQQGHLQPFYERGNGREALFFYMLWGSVEIFGKGPWQHHIVSALIGVLSVLVCFLVARRLFRMGSPPNDQAADNKAINIALLSAFFMAVSTWHIVLSRTAFRAILIPLFSGLTFYFLLATYQAATAKARLWFAAATGAAFALGFYTYIAFRIMAPILFFILLWPLLAAFRQKIFWQQIKKYFLPAIGLACAFIIIIYPIGKYFYTHPGSFVGRAGQVSVFNPSLYTFDGIQFSGKPPLLVVGFAAAEVFKTQFLGFFTHGDLNWRQNISSFPFLSPLVSPFFAAGLLVAIYFAIRYFFAPARRARWWKYFVFVVWFFGMLMPVVATAEGIPHGLRSIGVIPLIFIISAWAIYEFAGFIYKLHRRIWEKCWCHSHLPATSKHPHSLRFTILTWGLVLVAIAFFIALILQAYFLYFVYAYNDPANFYYFRSDLTPVSQYLVQRCDRDHTYLVLDKFSVQTTDYLTSDPKGNFSSPCNVPYQQVDPENSWQLSNLQPGDEIVFTQSSVFDTKKFKAYHPQAYLSSETRNKFGQTVMAVYKINQ